MAYMSDEVKEFFQDCKDKKMTARSARNTRSHCGKGGAVKFPSDNLTKKELKAMSGECKSYRLNDPMTWAEFKEMPDDLKVVYIKALRNKYGVPDCELAEMFGIHRTTLCNNFKTLGLSLGVGKSVCGTREWDNTGWIGWCSGVKNTPAAEPETLGEEPVKDIPVEDVPVIGESDGRCGECLERFRDTIPVFPKSGDMMFEQNFVDDILKTIKTLLGDGRVNVHIAWEFPDPEDVCEN